MITELRIPYPDFKMGDMIDPEQHDMNNLYIQLKVNSIVELCNKITGEDPSGITGAELMALKPIAPFTETKIQTFLQALINRLQASTGSTGANLIGASAKIKLTGSNVDAQLAFIDAWMQTAFVGTAQLQDASVTTPKLANLSVTEQKLADNSVTTPKLNNGAVTNPKLGNASVSNEKLVDLAVTEPKIANEAVTTSKYANLSVTAPKLANQSVTTDKMVDLNVTTSKFADLAVTEPKLASNSVTTPKILNLSVTEQKLADLSVTRPKLASRSVDSTKLELLAVQNENIANQAVGNTKLADRAVTSIKIGTEQVKLEHLDPTLLQTLPESQLTQKVLKLETDVGQLQLKDTIHDQDIATLQGQVTSVTDIANTNTDNLSAHTSNATIHVTSADKLKWNLDADNIVKDKSDGVGYPDPNTFLDAKFITNHANAQSPGSGNSQVDFWYIEQIFYSDNKSSNSRSQLARTYMGAKADMKVRHYYSGTWSPWSPSIQLLQQGGGSVAYGFKSFDPSSATAGATSSYVIPEGVNTIYVTAIGAGGGGGGANNYGAGGGGSGAVAFRSPHKVTPGETLTVTIGSGGGPGNYGGNGGNGGLTSVARGSHILVSVSGGNGGGGGTTNSAGYGGNGGATTIKEGTLIPARLTPLGFTNYGDVLNPHAPGTLLSGIRGFDANSTIGGQGGSLDGIGVGVNRTLFNFLTSFSALTPFSSNYVKIGAGGFGSNSNGVGQVGYSGYCIIEWGL